MLCMYVLRNFFSFFKLQLINTLTANYEITRRLHSLPGCQTTSYLVLANVKKIQIFVFCLVFLKLPWQFFFLRNLKLWGDLVQLVNLTNLTTWFEMLSQCGWKPCFSIHMCLGLKKFNSIQVLNDFTLFQVNCISNLFLIQICRGSQRVNSENWNFAFQEYISSINNADLYESGMVVMWQFFLSLT